MDGQIPTPYAPPSGTPASASGNRSMAVLAYLSVLVIVPLVSGAKNDTFVKFHVKQGLVLLAIEIAGWVIAFLLGGFVLFLFWPASVVLSVIGIINAATGKMKEIPLVGGFASSFKF